MVPRVTGILAGQAGSAEPVTTCGRIALVNLQAQISSRQKLAGQKRLSCAERAGLADLLLLRGQVLGRIADYERAEQTASLLVSEEPEQGLAFLVRARTRATFHRFTPALRDLTSAERLGADPTEVDTERAVIHQALGHYDQALELLHQVARHHSDFQSLGALAGLYAQRTEIARAERLFTGSRSRYRGVSPFPLALLDFHRGRMWQRQNDLFRSRLWFDAALRRLPDMAPAQGCYAQVEAALGDTTSAVARLKQLVTTADDPDYPAQLAVLLKQSGQTDEARLWSEGAAARYDQLCSRHPDAFTDHLARFRLAIGHETHSATGEQNVRHSADHSGPEPMAGTGGVGTDTAK